MVVTQLPDTFLVQCEYRVSFEPREVLSQGDRKVLPRQLDTVLRVHLADSVRRCVWYTYETLVEDPMVLYAHEVSQKYCIIQLHRSLAW